MTPTTDAEAEDERNYRRTIAKEEIIPDADLEAERNKYLRHTRSQGPVRENQLVHEHLLERRRNVGFQNEILFIGKLAG